jgi:hypothetical protein
MNYCIGKEKGYFMMEGQLYTRDQYMGTRCMESTLQNGVGVAYDYCKNHLRERRRPWRSKSTLTAKL